MVPEAAERHLMVQKKKKKRRKTVQSLFIPNVIRAQGERVPLRLGQLRAGQPQSVHTVQILKGMVPAYIPAGRPRHFETKRTATDTDTDTQRAVRPASKKRPRTRRALLARNLGARRTRYAYEIISSYGRGRLRRVLGLASRNRSRPKKGRRKRGIVRRMRQTRLATLAIAS